MQRSKAGDRDFGPPAALDYTATVLGWMDRHLRGISSIPFEPPVRVFVMGANHWRTSDRWPLPGLRRDTFYLAPARGRGEAGKLGRQPPSDRRRETIMRSDPAHPGTDPFEGRFGAHDYRALKPGPSVAVFETPGLPEPLEIIGRVVVELAVSATVPDFDLWVQLYDVAPDGTAWNLSTPGTALQRASYRESPSRSSRQALPRAIERGGGPRAEASEAR